MGLVLEYFYLVLISLQVILYSIAVVILLTWESVRGKIALLASCGITLVTSIGYLMNSILAWNSSWTSEPDYFTFVQWYYAAIGLLNVIAIVFLVVGLFQISQHFNLRRKLSQRSEGQMINPDDIDA